jgi:hypothetical protein
MTKEEKQKVKSKNKLLRYKLIKELYQEVEKAHPYTPMTQILQKYIFPIYPISRVTLYGILCTSITTQLREIETIEAKYLN